MKPLIIVNFKTYREATGKRAIKLAQVCLAASKRYRVEIIVSPQYTDLRQVFEKVKIPVMSQHVDAVEPGKHTGYVSPWAVKTAGARGTFLGHSERRLALKEMKKTVKLCKKYGLRTVCFARDLATAKKIARLSPDYLAYEPPELIGGKRSVSKTKPQVISKIVSATRKINPRVKVLVGAGITNAGDVRKSLTLGAKGVMLASGFVLAKNPQKVISSLAAVAKEFK